MNQLPLFFKKELSEKSTNWITYETQEITEVYTGDSQTVVLEIKGLILIV